MKKKSNTNTHPSTSHPEASTQRPKQRPMADADQPHRPPVLACLPCPFKLAIRGPMAGSRETGTSSLLHALEPDGQRCSVIPLAMQYPPLLVDPEVAGNRVDCRPVDLLGNRAGSISVFFAASPIHQVQPGFALSMQRNREIDFAPDIGIGPGFFPILQTPLSVAPRGSRHGGWRAGLTRFRVAVQDAASR